MNGNLMKIKGFLPYLTVAFLNACVDLAHKITIQDVLMKSYHGNQLIVLTAIVNAMILIPFILLFSPSGFISDRFSKTRVVRIASLVSVVIAVAVLFSYIAGLFWVAFILTLILAAQSAIYSPAKYGLIKSIVGIERLGAANGIVQALTVVAILFSSFIFSFLFEHLYGGLNTPNQIIANIWPIGVILVLFSASEAFFAFRLPVFEPSNEEKTSTFDFKRYVTLSYLSENIKSVRMDRNIWLSIVALSVFWGISQIVIAAFPAHYKIAFNSDNTVAIQGILALSGIGMIIGSTLAGSLSKHHIEHGTIPVGALGICISLFVFGVTPSVVTMAICSLLFGVFGGMFLVPLNATIQYFAPEKEMGKIIAGNNFIQNIFMLTFLVLSVVIIELLHLSTTGLFTISAIVCLIGGLYAVLQLPHLFTRIMLMPILKSNYHFNVIGIDNLPQRGGVLLLGNHISWIDWLVLQVASPRAIKFVMYRGIYNKWYLKYFMKFFNVIPIGMGSGKDSLQEIASRLKNGEVVALFPEGHISYNGQINEFQKGYELALQDVENICIVPFYLRGLWGSTFSRANDYYKELTKKQGKREIIVAFGKPIYQFTDHIAMKQKVLELSFSSWEHFISRQKPITEQWLSSAKRDIFSPCISDSVGSNLNHLKFITAVLLFAQSMKNELSGMKHIGVLMPSSAGGAIVNMALFVLGKIPVNLNYTVSEDTMRAALRKADIKRVITSEKFLEKLESKGFSFKEILSDKTIFAEEIGNKFSKSQKVKTMITALLSPSWLLKWLYFEPCKLSDTATILFSSGSEGEPKGIELTHKNLIANIKQIGELLNFRKDDVILNSLPIFHSFGLTVTTLMPLCEGVKMVSVPDPTDGATIGKMAARHNVSIIFGTSTFFRLYVRNKKLHPLMFQSARIIVAGAEKLKPDVKDAFKLKFGQEIFEGYGATETAPVSAVNTPNILELTTLKEMTFNKVGSVGLPLPGTVIKIINPDTLEELPIGEDGLIIIGGSQVMKGYLDDEEKTAEVIIEIDGIRYYKTGDKGHIDEQGFIFITDRYSRFAKIGGEMISLGSVEENIINVLGNDIPLCAVNVPDDKKGEAVALLICSEQETSEIDSQLRQSDISSLMLPTHILKIEKLPMLASGKTDFKGAKKLAIELLENNNHSLWSN